MTEDIPRIFHICVDEYKVSVAVSPEQLTQSRRKLNELVGDIVLDVFMQIRVRQRLDEEQHGIETR